MAQGEGDNARAARKAAKKTAKAAKRAKREGTLASGSKDCDLCSQPKDMLIRRAPYNNPAITNVLITRSAHRCGYAQDCTAGLCNSLQARQRIDTRRCMTDESRAWRMVCTKCWKDVSGGVEDGDEDHPHYRRVRHCQVMRFAARAGPHLPINACGMPERPRAGRVADVPDVAWPCVHTLNA